MASRADDAAAEARDAAAKARALRKIGAAIARETAEIMDHRAAVLEAMGAPEARIHAVRAFAESERRVAAEWALDSETAAK